MADPSAGIRPDIQTAIDAAYPDGVIDWVFEVDQYALETRLIHLRSSFNQFDGARLMFEESAWCCRTSSQSRADPDDEDSWDTAPLDEFDRTDDRYFLGLTDPRFKSITDGIDYMEDGRETRVEWIAFIGLTVAVSAFAPFAAIQPGMYEESETGHTLPDLGVSMWHEDGRPVDMYEYFQELHGEKAATAVRTLHEEVTAELNAAGLTVIPDEELQKPVPGLERNEELIPTGWPPEAPPTVRDAFFFAML